MAEIIREDVADAVLKAMGEAKAVLIRQDELLGRAEKMMEALIETLQEAKHHLENSINPRREHDTRAVEILIKKIEAIGETDNAH